MRERGRALDPEGSCEQGGKKATKGAARRRRVLLTWGLSMVGGALLLVLASQRLEVIPNSIEIVRPELFAWAIALHLPYAAIRALRLRYALDPLVRAQAGCSLDRLPPRVLYGSGWLSFAVIMLLPLRLGELSRPLLLRRAQIPGIGLGEAISAVATERVVDGLMVVGLLFGGLALAAPSAGAAALGEVRAVGQLMAVIFGVGLAAVIMVSRAPESAISRLRLGSRAASLVRRLAAAIRPLGRPAQGVPFLLWSLVYWAITVTQLWLCARACGLDLEAAQAAAIVATIGLSIQLPGGPAQAGSFQVGAAAGLSLFVNSSANGALQGPAVSFSALMYLLSLGGTFFLALPGAWLLRPGTEPAADGARPVK